MEELQRQIDELKQELDAIKADSTIPNDVEQAFRKRLKISTFTPISGSNKAASSENQAVNEGGIATYSVLKTPDGFLQVTIANTVYYLPYFS